MEQVNVMREENVHIPCLQERKREQVNVMREKKVHIPCLQQTKRRERKAMELREAVQTIMFICSKGTKNGVKTVVGQNLKDKIITYEKWRYNLKCETSQKEIMDVISV